MIEPTRPISREPRYQIRVADLRKKAQERLLIDLHEFKGHDLVSMRVWLDKPGSHDPRGMVPSPKGVTIAANLIPQLRQALEEAERVAIEKGILQPI